MALQESPRKLARELGVDRSALYRLRNQLDPTVKRGQTIVVIGNRSSATEGEAAIPAASRENIGGGVFERCLAKSRGSTPAESKLWREDIYEQIRALMSLQGGLRIERMCYLMGVSRAGFYRFLKEQMPVQEELEVGSAIQQVALEHRRRYGHRRISAELRRRGMVVNRKRVLRIMREDNLLALRSRKFVFSADSKYELEVYLNLARHMRLTEVNQLWVADVMVRRRGEAPGERGAM